MFYRKPLPKYFNIEKILWNNLKMYYEGVWRILQRSHLETYFWAGVYREYLLQTFLGCSEIVYINETYFRNILLLKMLYLT